MHELSLALNVVEILEETAKTERFSKIKQIWLSLGAMACVEEHALYYGLDVAFRGTVAQGAKIHLIHLPANGWCFNCDQPIELPPKTSHCPVCQSSKIQIDNDTSLKIKELEVE